jgi:7-alpha-hydroxysteroid dehydrogenase
VSALAGRVAIVTGGGWNIGRGIALGFARAGARVVVAARTRARLDETVAAIEAEGGEALAVATDVTDLAQVEALRDAALERFGTIDVLAAIAGGGAVGEAIDAMDPGAFDRILRRNVTSTFYCARSVLPVLRKKRTGSILTCAGGGAFFPLVGMHATAYACAKTAVCRFTDQLQIELLDTGIRVNCLDPGFVPDPTTRAAIEAEERASGRPHPHRAQMRTPQDAAELATFLVSAQSEPLRGRVVSVYDDWWKDRQRLLAVEQTIHHYRVRRYDLF